MPKPSTSQVGRRPAGYPLLNADKRRVAAAQERLTALLAHARVPWQRQDLISFTPHVEISVSLPIWSGTQPTMPHPGVVMQWLFSSLPNMTVRRVEYEAGQSVIRARITVWDSQ